MNFFLISSRTGFVASVSCHSNGINRATVHRSNNAKMYQTQIRRLQLVISDDSHSPTKLYKSVRNRTRAPEFKWWLNDSVLSRTAGKRNTVAFKIVNDTWWYKSTKQKILCGDSMFQQRKPSFFFCLRQIPWISANFLIISDRFFFLLKSFPPPISFQ